MFLKILKNSIFSTAISSKSQFKRIQKIKLIRYLRNPPEIAIKIAFKKKIF